ncbi:hypothetical protein DS745_06855 [Anaerobacillus alkaliphilus]|uniref:Uncharacterized protein n=2 Tax=Anaerobacillus alkaliphilus TaxID=1548597 RepID=A0A4Q0VUW7_9BACI|nr:hypothetical protein DS745_06855 [Anaerobacillus alkaliphilus]
MSYKLRQLIGCEIKMDISCGEDCEIVEGKLCFVGSDYVEVELKDDKKDRRDPCKKKDKKEKDKFVRIYPFESIKSFEHKKSKCDCCK